MTKKETIALGYILIGLILIVTTLYMIWPPLGLGFIGLFLLAAGVNSYIDRKRENTKFSNN